MRRRSEFHFAHGPTIARWPTQAKTLIYTAVPRRGQPGSRCLPRPRLTRFCSAFTTLTGRSFWPICDSRLHSFFQSPRPHITRPGDDSRRSRALDDVVRGRGEQQAQPSTDQHVEYRSTKSRMLGPPVIRIIVPCSAGRETQPSQDESPRYGQKHVAAPVFDPLHGPGGKVTGKETRLG